MGLNRRILFLADINSIHIERWVRNLKAKGFEIGIFSLCAKNTTWADELEVYYKCFNVSDEMIQTKSRFGKAVYFKAIKELRPLIDVFNPDIVHAHYASSYGMLAKKLKFPATVLSLWGSDIYEFPKRSFLHRMLLKSILKSIPVICSTSNAMANEARKYVDREYKITPFGVDTERFTDQGNDNEIFTIGTVKTLENVYGIDRLILVYNEYRKRSKIPSRAVIYGRGGQLDNLNQVLKERKLEDHVTFPGFVSDEALIEAFNSLDVFLSLSRSESYGVATLEAQSCGVPAIVTNVGGLPEVLDPESGYIVGNDIIEESVEALLQLEDTELRRKKAKSAREFVVRHYSNEACVNKLIEVYELIK